MGRFFLRRRQAVIETTGTDTIYMFDLDRKLRDVKIWDSHFIEEYSVHLLNGIKRDEMVSFDYLTKYRSLSTTESLFMSSIIQEFLSRILTDSLLINEVVGFWLVRTEKIRDEFYFIDSAEKSLLKIEKDTILLSSLKRSLQEVMVNIDKILLKDSIERLQDKILIDRFLFLDNIIKAYIRGSIDSVLFSEVIYKLRSMVIDERFFINDVMRKSLIHNEFDSMMLADIYRLEKMKVELVRSGFLLNDIKYISLEKQLGDPVLLDSVRRSLLDYDRKDGFLLSDASSTSLLFIRNILDSLFLSDSEIIQNIRGRIQSDGVFFNDVMTKILDKIQKDGVLIGDDYTAQTYPGEGGALVEKLVTDAILMNDYKNILYAALITDKMFLTDGFPESLLEMIVTDYLFVRESSPQFIMNLISDTLFLQDDNVMRMIEKSFRDLFFLSDSTSFTALKEILSIDKIFLSDTRQQLLIKKIEDRLLLGDELIKLLEKWLIDKTFLGDSSSFEQGTQLITRLSTDQVLFIDVVRKLREGVLLDDLLLYDNSIAGFYKTLLSPFIFEDSFLSSKSLTLSMIDKIFINDSYIAQRLKQVMEVDSLLLMDFRVSELRKILRDDEFTAEVIMKLLESTKTIDLLFRDSSTSQIFGAIIAFLTYARMKTINYMNIELSETDLLGRTMDTIDYLGRVIGVGAKPRYD